MGLNFCGFIKGGKFDGELFEFVGVLLPSQTEETVKDKAQWMRLNGERYRIRILDMKYKIMELIYEGKQ